MTGVLSSETAKVDVLAAVTAGRRERRRRAVIVITALVLLVIGLAAFALMFGRTWYGPTDVLRVILGDTAAEGWYAISELRIPQVVMGATAGFAFGIAGVTFQTMLRNPLASPDIIGISSGASAAAVFAIIVLGLSGLGVSIFALVGAIITAIAIAAFSFKNGLSGARLILIGIGIAAMLDATVTALLSRANAWDIQSAMRWITGSLNNANWDGIYPLLAASAVLIPVLLLNAKNLSVLRLGDDTAAGLGVRINLVRIVLILAAVALIAFATSAAGPIAFVAFLSGPIAARLVGSGASPLLPAGLIGAVLVLGGHLLGQYAFGDRLPVGVVTGMLGAPYLIFLLIRMNRSGAGL